MSASSMEVPPSGPAVAKFAGPIIGGRPSVRRYYDQDDSNAVAILTCDAAPAAGWTTWSTVTLHTSPNVLNGCDKRVELMASARSTDDALANAVASAAFLVAKDDLVFDRGTWCAVMGPNWDESGALGDG